MDSKIYIFTTIFFLTILAFDLLHAWSQRKKEPTLRSATIMTLIYVSLAFAFGILMVRWTDPVAQQSFFASWITEYSLSLDNLFVFILIFARLNIPKHRQEIVLLFGIGLSLVLRAIFLLFGIVLVQRWTFMLFIFGGFLIYTAIQIVRDDGDEEWEETRIMRFMHEKKFSINAIAFLSIATTDVMFAFDSIPAVIGITQNSYVILTANFFALMGLRQLYFLVEKLISKLAYLSLGLAVVLLFIGLKLNFEALHHYGHEKILGIRVPEISLQMSLLVIVAILGVTTIASLIKKQRPHFPL
jgi:tellurite resistance protein TerC